MDTKLLQEKFNTMHLLSRQERISINTKIRELKPEFYKEYGPKWWYWRRCTVNVLVVADQSLNFSAQSFGLSEFLGIFTTLQQRTFTDYRVTTAHRGSDSASADPQVVNRIDNFNFASSVNLNDFDEVWIFAFSTSALTALEIRAITAYMDQGGGLFATGDHGSIGIGMGGQIPRVKDMRHWESFPTPVDNDTNEVSMTGQRRNDTNTPRPGNSIADTFSHQRDIYPQKIGVRMFDEKPHPLLSISNVRRQGGIINIMPDHPHEGECKPETTFSVNGVAIASQNIATSFVNGGNVTARKDPSQPHCFPSIGVWDGISAGAGRIVVDSTWHHFVNINVEPLPDEEESIIKQYFMNIATWMCRRNAFFCWIQWEVWDLFRDSQLIEAALDNPATNTPDITVPEFGHIGALAEELLSEKYGPAIARDILVELAQESGVTWSQLMSGYDPTPKDGPEFRNIVGRKWINLDYLLHIAIGRGFIEMRDDKDLSAPDPEEKSIERLLKVFYSGVDIGTGLAAESLSKSLSHIESQFR